MPDGLRTQTPALTTEQKAALSVITAAGGVVGLDEQGMPVAIDLASDRVFANDEVVRAVLQFPHVRQLRLAVSRTTAETLAPLASLDELEELLLQDAPLSDEQLSSLLASLPALQRLTLRRLSQVTDAVGPAIVARPRLEVLALIEMNQLTGVMLDQLPSMNQLRSLDVRDCGGLAAADLSKLAAMRQLSEVKLGGPAIDDDVLLQVVLNPGVTSLVVEDAQISGECLQRLAAVPELAGRLRSLSLSRCFGVSDESLLAISRFPQLDTLALRDILVTGEFLTRLATAVDKPLPLKTLVINKGFVGDDALQSLPKLFPQLTRLDLRGNVNVTDAALDTLRQLSELRVVQLEETGVTVPAAALPQED